MCFSAWFLKTHPRSGEPSRFSNTEFIDRQRKVLTKARRGRKRGGGSDGRAGPSIRHLVGNQTSARGKTWRGASYGTLNVGSSERTDRHWRRSKVKQAGRKHPKKPQTRPLSLEPFHNSKISLQRPLFPRSGSPCVQSETFQSGSDRLDWSADQRNTSGVFCSV